MAKKAAKKRQTSSKRRASMKKTSAAKGGRPEFEPTPEQRLTVEVMIAARQGEEDIARALGIARGTLRKCFKEEIATGRAKKMADVLTAQFRSAIAGSASAQSKFLSACGYLVPDGQPKPPASKPAPAAEKLGKKENAQIEAHQPPADAEWRDLMGDGVKRLN